MAAVAKDRKLRRNLLAVMIHKGPQGQDTRSFIIGKTVPAGEIDLESYMRDSVRIGTHRFYGSGLDQIVFVYPTKDGARKHSIFAIFTTKKNVRETFTTQPIQKTHIRTPIPSVKGFPNE
jgi:hypothetical protein